MSGARQLHLFKGKRQRGVQAPPPLEIALHIPLARILRDFTNAGWIWTHFPAGEHRNKVTAGLLKAMGLRRGFPDFLFFSAMRHCAFLELKRRGRTTSDDQDEVLEFLEAAGHPVLVTHDLKQAVDWLKAIGVLRSVIEVQ